MTTSKQTVTKRRRMVSSLTDSERYVILKAYSEGKAVKEMAEEYGIEDNRLNAFIQSHLKSMLVTRETNELMQQPAPGREPGMAIVGTISKCLTPQFIKLVEENAEIYAYYFVQTNDNQFSLEQSGLNIGVPKTMILKNKQHVFKVRGQYIRSIPAIQKYIKDEQDKRMLELDVGKPFVQRELLEQIEQLKQLSSEDGRQRSNLLKSIELLGKTIGAFTDHLVVDEGNAKTGLDILMDKVREEEGLTIYEASEDQAE